MAWTMLVNWLLQAITIILVGIRLWVRSSAARNPDKSRMPGTLHRRWWILSDGFVVTALIFNLIGSVTAVLFYQMHYPHPDPNYRWPKEQAMKINRIGYNYSVMSMIPPYAIKAAMLCFYAEVVPRAFSRIWWSIRIMGVFLFISTGATMGIWGMWCKTNFKPNAHCVPTDKVAPKIISAICCIGTDLMVYILPFFILHTSKKLPRKQRIGIAVMFSLGFLAVFCTCMVAWSGWDVETRGYKTLVNQICSRVEHYTAIWLACVPAFNRLVRSSMRKVKDRPTSDSGSSGTGTGTGTAEGSSGEEEINAAAKVGVVVQSKSVEGEV